MKSASAPAAAPAVPTDATNSRSGPPSSLATASFAPHIGRKRPREGTLDSPIVLLLTASISAGPRDRHPGKEPRPSAFRAGDAPPRPPTALPFRSHQTFLTRPQLAVLTDPTTGRSGGIGRRGGLKIRCPQGLEGSSPSFGTRSNRIPLPDAGRSLGCGTRSTCPAGLRACGSELVALRSVACRWRVPPSAPGPIASRGSVRNGTRGAGLGAQGSPTFDASAMPVPAWRLRVAGRAGRGRYRLFLQKYQSTHS